MSKLRFKDIGILKPFQVINGEEGDIPIVYVKTPDDGLCTLELKRVNCSQLRDRVGVVPTTRTFNEEQRVTLTPVCGIRGRRVVFETTYDPPRRLGEEVGKCKGTCCPKKPPHV